MKIRLPAHMALLEGLIALTVESTGCNGDADAPASAPAKGGDDEKA